MSLAIPHQKTKKIRVGLLYPLEGARVPGGGMKGAGAQLLILFDCGKCRISSVNEYIEQISKSSS